MANSGDGAPATKRSVLLADVDWSQRLANIMLLHERGYEVLQTEQADTLPALVRQHRPDVVLLDASLSMEAVLLAVQRLRQDPAGPDQTPRVLVTCSPRVSAFVLHNLAEAGVNQVLLKPYSGQDLLQRIDLMLKGRNV
jgi:two-component system, HptB-dependent secretion and biofilm response regulator